VLELPSTPAISPYERRQSPRYAINRPITFRRPALAAASALLINLAEGGALARIKIPEDTFIPPWPLRLANGDELWMADLIDRPLLCWIIEIETDLVRVHIYNDHRIRPRLRALIERLATKEA
jgi:hypothetical protein